MLQTPRDAMPTDGIAQEVRRRKTKRAVKRFANSIAKKTGLLLAAVAIACLGVGLAVATNSDEVDSFGVINEPAATVAESGQNGADQQTDAKDQSATDATASDESDPANTQNGEESTPDASDDPAANANEGEAAAQSDEADDQPASDQSADANADKGKKSADDLKKAGLMEEGDKSDKAPGTAQNLVHEGASSGVNFWAAQEDGVTFPVYCFNSSLAWPDHNNGSKTESDELFIPDNMEGLSDSVKEKLYRLFYAGYPHNNAGLYSKLDGEWVPTLDEIKQYSTPPTYVKEAFPDIAWDTLDFSVENLLYTTKVVDHIVNGVNRPTTEYIGTPECEALEEVSNVVLDFFGGDTSLADRIAAEDPFFMATLMTHGPYGQATSVEDLQQSLQDMGTPGGYCSDADARVATQYAVWLLLNEAGVPKNGKSWSDFSSVSSNIMSVVKKLVDFANGTDEYKNVHVPDRKVTSADMEAYRDNLFKTGMVLLREDDTPVGSSPITFTQKNSGVYVSETLHFSDKAYALPYEIALVSDGGKTTHASVQNHGSGSFQLIVSEKPEGSNISVSVTSNNYFPTDVYQYVAKSDAGKADRKFQEMAGVSFNTVPLSFAVGTTFVPMGMTSVKVKKAWEDDNNRDNIRPSVVKVQLYANEKPVEGAVANLDQANSWTSTFDNLLTSDDEGQAITYTVKEVSTPAGYTSKVSGDQASGFTITNTHAPATITISGEKIWNDADDANKARPKSITVRLHADLPGEASEKTATVTPNDAGEWTYTFPNLHKFHNGEEIRYSVTEDAVDNYSSKVQGRDIINTYTPGETSVSVTKVWDDADDQDGIRPDFVKVGVFKNENDETPFATQILTETTEWEATFGNLPISDEKTHEHFQWTVKELDPTSGYKNKVEGDLHEGFTITNTHKPATTSIEGKKTWDDADNQDGKRPGKIVVFLKANGEDVDVCEVTADDKWQYKFTNLPERENGEVINYTVVEEALDGWSTTYDGYNITNKHTPGKTSVTVEKSWEDRDNQDGIRPTSVTVQLYANGEPVKDKTVVLNDNNGWEDSFTELDEFKAGHRIAYTVQEVLPQGATSIEGYDAPVVSGDAREGFTIVNAHTPETTSVKVTKEWVDDNNAESLRPDSVTVILMKNGIEEDEHQITANAAGKWEYTFENLPKKEHGETINYEVVEKHVENYTAHIEATADGFNITNTLHKGETSIEVVKSWEDHSNQDGKRPATIGIQLFANGTAVEGTKGQLVLDGRDHWMGVFEGLPDRTDDGKRIFYTVKEVKGFTDEAGNAGDADADAGAGDAAGTGDAASEKVLDDYEVAISGSADTAFVVTNAHDVETISLSGTKIWDDKDDQDGRRPEKINVTLMSNGINLETKPVTAEDEWKWTFPDLPKYHKGEEIVYTISEEAVEDYSASIDQTKFEITNSYTPGETSLQVTKAWDDKDDADGIRPSEVKIYLVANGKKTEKFITLSAEGKWTGIFEKLDECAGGEKIEYAIEEEAVEGYTTVISGDATDGFVVTNTHKVIEPEPQPGPGTDDNGDNGGGTTGGTTDDAGDNGKDDNDKTDKKNDNGKGNNKGNESHADGSPKTGDHTMSLIFAALAVAVAAAAVGIFAARRARKSFDR